VTPQLDEATRHAEWEQSLADGAAGTALLHLESGEDGEDWLRLMLRHEVWAHPHDTSLFQGAPAVAFVLAATDLHAPLAVLDAEIDAIVGDRLSAAHQRMNSGALPEKREYDLITGLTGLGAYLLRRYNGGDLLRDVLTYVVRLTLPRHDGLPGWWAADGPTGPGPQWTRGHGNLGMAHGICGPLTLLALTAKRGITVAGHDEAIDRICRWLDRWRCDDGYRTWWPETVTRAEHDAGRSHSHTPTRPSWCYGTPGIARAQQLAGLTLGDPERQRTAQRTMASCLDDQDQMALLGDVSICHGWAGVLHTAWRMGKHDDTVRAHIPWLLDQLTAWRHDQPAAQDGLLNGDAGVQLALRAASTDTAPATQWDACLLLDD